MDIKDSYLHGAIGVVKSISVNADKLTYRLADQANTPVEVTLPTVTQTANGLAPQVINTNTNSIGNTYYLLASSNGSSAPSWYKLPATAFSNDDTKVTLTNTTASASYRVLFSSTADDTTRTEGARKSTNLKFNPSTGNLTTTSLNLNGDIVINDGTNKDRYIKWQYNNTDQYGWRIGYLGDNNAHGNDNNALVFDSCQGTKGWAIALKLDLNSLNAVFTGTVTAPTFIGNIDGQYVNALTNYVKAEAIEAIATSDSLNSALGKLEYKTDFIYNDLIGGENNANVIDKWSEIKDFIAEVGNSTDITDVFVTRKTALTITGEKTFDKFLRFFPNTKGGHAYGLSNVDSDGDNKEKRTAGIGFLNNDGIFSGAYIGWGESPWSSANNLYVNDSTFTYKNYKILHANNSHITNGVITINGVSITPLTEHQSLSNYVTLTTTQTISGSKTFTSTLTTRSINPLSNNTYSLGTSDKKWSSLYATNIYSNAIYNGTTIYASNNEIIHADSSYFELNKGYPNSIMWLNASEYKLNLGSKGVQFMIAANGNVGIGDVGGAPAYKLHVGGGDVMADTVHAWSGGFKKNGSSDSYVLLGGGGHKLMSTFFTSLTSDSTNAISITICGTTKSISKSTLASSLGSLKNPYALTVFGVSYDGSAVKTVDMSTLIGVLGTGDSPITDSTHLLTSHISGFNSTGNITTIYKRTANHLWSYIKGKTDGEYVTALGINGNYVTWTKNGTDHDLTVPYASSSSRLLLNNTKNLQGLRYYYEGLTGSDDKTGAFVGPLAGTTTYSSILRLQSHIKDGELYYRDLIFDVNSDRIWSRRVTNSGNPVLREIPMIRKVEFTPTPTNEGWYRFASFSTNSGRVSNCIFSILRSYYSPENEHYVFSVSIGYNGHISITLLSGYTGGHLISKIRVVYNNSSTCYLDFHMTSTDNALYKNAYAVEIYSGDGTIQTPTLTTTVGGTAYEFTTVNGCKSDRGFTGNLSGAATTLAAVSVISNKKFTSLTNASWTDTGYTFTELESGTYAILVTSTNLVASGIMSVYKNISDSVGDEIPLHVYGTAGWRPYLRTSSNKLLISSNDVTAATNGRTVTIKIAKIL